MDRKSSFKPGQVIIGSSLDCATRWVGIVGEHEVFVVGKDNYIPVIWRYHPNKRRDRRWVKGHCNPDLCKLYHHPSRITLEYMRWLVSGGPVVDCT